jgi:hypothetical protein
MKIWWIIESTGKRNIPAEPQTIPEKAILIRNHMSCLLVSVGFGDERENLRKSRYLKRATDTHAPNHTMRAAGEMTFQSMKVRIRELTSVAIKPIGVCL